MKRQQIKNCSHCKKEKPSSEFSIRKRSPDGLQHWCKTCRKINDHKFYIKNRERLKKSPKKQREAHLKSVYGITLEQYDKMFETQNGVCAICSGINKDGRRLFVDHDHKTGEIRGLLCYQCNSLLGRFEVHQEKIIEFLGL